MLPTLIQDNQPLLAVSLLFLFIIVLLVVLQYVMVRYAEPLFRQIRRYWLMLRRYLGQSAAVIALKNTHPTGYHFLSQRFDIRHFYGLPLTLLFVGMGYIVLLFIGLVEDVMTVQPIVAMDYFVSAQMSRLHDSSLIKFFIVMTSFASTVMTVLVMLVTAVICWVLRQRYLLIGLLIATIGSTAFTFLSKTIYHRARPIDILLVEHTYSFPSGHATITIALYGFIAYLLIRFSQHFSQQVRIFVVAVFFAILIGFSRILLNEHYLSDVLGGYLVGGLWLTVAISVTEWLSAIGKITWRIEWDTSHSYLLWLSAVGILLSTLTYAKLYQFPLLS
ncbi:phosphatase PAP2 family protein [Psychrobacter sp. 16-MNA-CIBAN-0192]|uniref:phosphatase PAP2 family protein n=1 Tax=Psychrobacter sp. 16-MNA-CIBAN-0192 TaxID=3140448 RepID=UPI00331E9EE5